MAIQTISPDWPAPENIVALSTTRNGGLSRGRYSSLNLGHHVGDDPSALSANRQLLQEALPGGGHINWLNQVQGTSVVPARERSAAPDADACWSNTPGMICAILTADCLPVLICNQSGSMVAAAHAGWRGLLHGVLEATVAAMPVAAQELLVWFGPAIGPEAFEVGEEVRSQFLQRAADDQRPAVDRCFKACAEDSSKYLADLPALASVRLRAMGVSKLYGCDLCTHSNPERFFSYRRDGETGRMASLICIKSG